MQIQTQQPVKTKELVIVPGSKGYYLKNDRIFLVTEIFYSPSGLKYRGKFKQNISLDESLSRSPVVTVNKDDVLEMDDSLTGIYNYNTGTIE